MGIPSYYRKLLDTVSGLINKNHPDTNINWLFMDYNCLIYHVLHKETTPPYSGDNNREEWESEFLDCIIKYTLKVIKTVDPKKGVVICIDGVVPMAKMRQQRLRRFKSIWQTQHSENQTSSDPVWDRNSITPGTIFMKKLRSKLETMISKNGKKSWILSSSDEPGEGEHKIINEWRKGIYNGDFAVYGLDADLIVLSLLGYETCNFNNNLWLFREGMNEGKVAFNEDGEEIFEWFSINSLRDWLSSDYRLEKILQRQFMLNYCFAMSILGNDFLPTSLSLKIRDDGHSELLDIIKKLTSDNISLVDSITLHVTTNIKLLFDILKVDEEKRIYKYIHKKQILSRNLGQQIENINTFKVGENNWPLSHIEESILIDNTKSLTTNWKEKYLESFFNGFTFNKNNINKICKEYLYGIQWIWAYYIGNSKNVCFNWFYPFNLPPLWSWISDYLNENKDLPSFPEKILIKASDIKPTEQLSLVLPLESWNLIPPCPEKNLPNYAPQYFPSSFSFESTGKRFFWECESLIPLPNIYEIKEIIKLNT
jgi:5'-3' exonuclease